MDSFLDILAKSWHNMHYFLCFHVSWGTFRLLGDLWETNFIQKVPLGDFGPL